MFLILLFLINTTTYPYCIACILSKTKTFHPSTSKLKRPSDVMELKYYAHNNYLCHKSLSNVAVA